MVSKVWLSFLVIVSLFATSVLGGKRGLFHGHAHLPMGVETPGTANCSERFFEQRLDHFHYGPRAGSTFRQRYFVCKEKSWSPGKPIFFYTGNEASVDLFVNATGLMWENADKFGAMLVFAEHRYFGKSLPFVGEPMPQGEKLQYLSVDQALADYATLIEQIRFTDFFGKGKSSPSSAVVGFGGSYGGMLCSWLRVKYPMALDGCIAGSAPIVNFEDMSPKFDYNSFATTETFDATAEGGATDLCAANVRQSWQDMFKMMHSEDGRAAISSAFRTCSPLSTSSEVMSFIEYAANSFGMMSMSSYPYPSTYLLLGGKGILPAYPMRVACRFLGQNFSRTVDRLAALRDAVGVYYNNTGDVMCLNMSATVNEATVVVDYLWGYLSCTTMFMPDGQNGRTDMFWNAPWNGTAQAEFCRSEWGVSPQPDWVQIQYGGYGVSSWGSNIVFSNGQLDPWKGGGIHSATAPSVKAILIADVGHHIDLMFSNPKDTAAIKNARALELENIATWIREKELSSKY